jgi:hypothetical protein
MGTTLKLELSALIPSFEHAGLVVLDKENHAVLLETIDRQADEIYALEVRIKRLLDDSRHHESTARGGL